MPITSYHDVLLNSLPYLAMQVIWSRPVQTSTIEHRVSFSYTLRFERDSRGSRFEVFDQQIFADKMPLALNDT